MRLYIDTSAYLTVLLSEDQSQDLIRLFRNAQIFSSTVLFIEAERTLIHYGRRGEITEEDLEKLFRELSEDAQSMGLKSFTSDLALTRQFPAIKTPRSLDLIHLRTAKAIHTHKNLDAFVTLDEKQRQAASEMLLPVWQPS